MSIIERAADRLGEHAVTPAPQRDAVTRVADDGAEPKKPRALARETSHTPHIDSGKPVVQINLAALHRRGMVTPNEGKTMAAEEFRIIKRPLIQNAFQHAARGGKNSKLVMITSALPKEGKTFCAINLAMSIAMERDHTVLLVDGDVARPSVLNTLGLTATRGLTDLLLDDTLGVEDVMLNTNVERLRVIPAGSRHKLATELLASQTMGNLLDEIANRYSNRIVIFDSPPLLVTTEARVLASHMGQIVVVVEAETTTQHALKEALRQLDACTNTSLVYNKNKVAPGDEYRYYSY